MDSPQLAADTGEILRRLVVATIVGAGLGFNRELRQKPAGLRTHALVGLGSAVVVIVTIQMVAAAGPIDGSALTRAIQGVVTGIGFIGGGAILQSSRGTSVHGLTTAATIWVVAGLGMACGAGLWSIALIGLGISLLTLVGGALIERKILPRVFHIPGNDKQA